MDEQEYEKMLEGLEQRREYSRKIREKKLKDMTP